MTPEEKEQFDLKITARKAKLQKNQEDLRKEMGLQPTPNNGNGKKDPPTIANLLGLSDDHERQVEQMYGMINTIPDLEDGIQAFGQKSTDGERTAFLVGFSIGRDIRASP